MNFAAKGPGMSLRAVFEVRYGTRKKRTAAMGIVYGERRKSTTAILGALYCNVGDRLQGSEQLLDEI